MLPSIRRFATKLKKLLRVLANRPYRRAMMRARVAAGIEHEALLASLQCETVVDIGANRGQFALVSRHCFPHARIISFEPLSAPADRFRAVFRDDPRVTLHQAAIAAESGEGTIHVSQEDDSSSLLPATHLQTSLYSGTHQIAAQTVELKRLQDVLRLDDLKPPALLKIDVQGYELIALQGCEELLQAFTFVYVECSFVELYAGQALAHEVIAYLHHAGFRVQGVYNLHYDKSGRSIQADLLFSSEAGPASS